MSEQYLKAEEIAKIFNVGVGTIYQWRRAGLIPDVKKPLRFRLSTVEKWLAERGEK